MDGGELLLHLCSVVHGEDKIQRPGSVKDIKSTGSVCFSCGSHTHRTPTQGATRTRHTTLQQSCEQRSLQTAPWRAARPYGTLVSLSIMSSTAAIENMRASRTTHRIDGGPSNKVDCAPQFPPALGGASPAKHSLAVPFTTAAPRRGCNTA